MMQSRIIKIGKKEISREGKTYINAEGATNHEGDVMLGIAQMREAAKAGADAFKIQTYTADELVTKDAPRFWDYEAKDKPATGTQYNTYSRVDELPWETYDEFKKEADRLGIEFMSTPFSIRALKRLEEVGVRAYKIASCDITNFPLLKAVAKTGKPIVLSTGISTMKEVHEAVDFINNQGNEDIVLLHCTITYPTPPEHSNLRAMQSLMKEFPELPIGLSDHTIGITVPLAAVALGARCIEKHYTTKKESEWSPDNWLAVDPRELKEMVDSFRTIEKAMGSPEKKPTLTEERAYKFARRSVVSAKQIKKGTTIIEEMLICKRPGTGISPKQYWDLIGMKAKQDIKEYVVLEWGMVE